MAKTTPEPGHTRGSRLLRAWRATRLQSRVAKLLDLDPAQYNALERGKKRPSLQKAGKIEKRTHGAVPVGAWLDKDPGVLVVEPEERRAS